MSSGNNDNSAGGGIAIVFGLIAAMAMMFLALVAFVAFVLTVIAIFAWNKPRRIGTMTIYPEEARAFVQHGLAGAVLLPVFLVFVNVFFGVTINWNLLPHIVAGGYVGGSLGLEILFAQDQEKMRPVDPAPVPSQQQILPPVKATAPQHPAEPFRFASWDDEEERS